MSTYLIPGAGAWQDGASGLEILLPGAGAVQESAAAASARYWLFGKQREVIGAMLKNTASQVIGAQMITASDGSAFTGSVTCYVTTDGGTQAAGGTGSGACTHEGNGYHTYVPTQAETNGDHIGFTFVGTGAVPASINVYTDAAYARLGAPAGASVSADIAAVKSETASILSDTGTDGVVVASIATDAISADALAADAVAEIADGLLGRNVSGGSSSGRTVKQALHVLRNKVAVSGGTMTVYDTDDSSSSWTAAVTGTSGADPITTIDPA